MGSLRAEFDITEGIAQVVTFVIIWTISTLIVFSVATTAGFGKGGLQGGAKAINWGRYIAPAAGFVISSYAVFFA